MAKRLKYGENLYCFMKFDVERFYYQEDVGGGYLEGFSFSDSSGKHFVVHETFSCGECGRYIQVGSKEIAMKIFDRINLEGSFKKIFGSLIEQNFVEGYLDYKFPLRFPFYR